MIRLLYYQLSPKSGIFFICRNYIFSRLFRQNMCNNDSWKGCLYGTLLAQITGLPQRKKTFWTRGSSQEVGLLAAYTLSSYMNNNLQPQTWSVWCPRIGRNKIVFQNMSARVLSHSLGSWEQAKRNQLDRTWINLPP